MTDSIVWRLVWKEYRVLRGFWLCLAAIGVTTFIGTTIIDTESARAGALAAAILMMPVFYLLGSIAVAFAAEREDGTDQVLQRLGASRGRLWLSKLGFDVVSALLLFGLLWLVAHSFFSFSSFHIRQPAGEGFDPSQSAIAWTAGFIAWGVFFSLVCRRVLTAVWLTVAASILTPIISNLALLSLLQAVPSIHITTGDQIDWYFRLVVLPALLLIESYRITRLWADDRRYRLPRWIEVPWRAVSVRVRPVEALGRAAAIASAVQSAAAAARPIARESTPPWRREFKRLAWLEWRTARWVTLATLAVLGCVLATAHSSGRYASPNHDLFMSLVVLAPAVFGLWSYTGEQKGRQFRWLTDQGLSPVQVWSIKHVVWLSAAIATVLVAIFVAAGIVFQAVPVTLTAAGWQGVPYAWTFGESVKQFFAAIGHLPVRFDDANRQQLIVPTLADSTTRCLLLVCLSYTVGHFVSILIPRAITATFITLIAWAGMLVWWLAMNAMHIPLAGSVVPWLPTLLLATWLFVTDWMLDRRSWRVWLKPFAVCAAGFAVIASYSIWFRVTEIVIPPRLAELLPRLNATSTSAASDAGSPLSEAWGGMLPSAAVQKEGDLWLPIPRFESVSVVHLAWQPIHPDAYKWLVQNREPLRLTVEALQNAGRPVIPVSLESERLNLFVLYSNEISWLLAASAWQFETDDQLAEAFDRHLLNLRWAANCSRNGGLRQAFSLSLIDLAVAGMARWAAHPKHTEDTLNAALARYRTFMLLHHAAEQSDALWKDFFDGKVEAKLPSWQLERIVMREGAADERHVVPLVIDHRHPLLPDLLDVIAVDHRTLLSEIQQDTTSAAINTSRRLFPWEQVRERRLANFLGVQALDDIGSLPLPFPRVNLAAEFHRRGWDRPPELFPESSQAAQWVRTTPSAWQVNLFYYNLRLLPQLVAHRIDTETRLRAVTLTLALTAFKLEHGAYPEHLADLPDAVRWTVETDAWTGRDFVYEPHGFSTPLAAKPLTLPEKQPFLQSPGLTEFPVEDPSPTNPHRGHAVPGFRSGWAADFAPSTPRQSLQPLYRPPLVFPLP